MVEKISIGQPTLYIRNEMIVIFEGGVVGNAQNIRKVMNDSRMQKYEIALEISWRPSQLFETM